MEGGMEYENEKCLQTDHNLKSNFLELQLSNLKILHPKFRLVRSQTLQRDE